jgi:hypothetical protein
MVVETRTGALDGPDDDYELTAAAGLSPRIGGGKDVTAWTGGSNQAARRLARPSSTMARRPTDFKSANTVEHIATKGLPEERHIGPDEKTSKITLTSWVNSVRSYMEERGMDTVFHVFDGQTNTETYLLTDWGSASPAKIEAWVATLRTGVPKPDGTLLPPCDYDLDNLKWSGKAILNSVSLPLWETVEKDLGVDASGPEAFAAVVYKLQQVSSAAVRTLVDELKNLSLLKEPGQDVEIFGGRVVELCRRISGTGSAPADLVVLAASTFLECDVLSFKLKAIKVHDDVDEDARVMTWDAVVRTLKTKYQSLKGQGLWTPQSTTKKKDDELSGLHAAINKLSAEVAGSRDGGGGKDGGGDKGGVRCYGCNELGHIARDCPKNRGSGSRSQPKEGEPHTKTVNGASQSWCNICRRWTKGTKEHLTEKHVRRDVNAPAPSPAPPPAPPSEAPAPAPALGGLAASDSQPGGNLFLQSGLFVGQLTDMNDEEAPAQADEVSANDAVTSADDPTMCPEDLFHVAANSLGLDESSKHMNHEEAQSHKTLGIYMLATTSGEMTSFLMRVARIRSVTGHNVESWVTAVESKLADVGILTIAMVIAEIHVINSKLFRAGHVPMYIRTLDIMVREGVKMKVTTELSVKSQNEEMLVFLRLVAESRQITGSNVDSWVTKVHAKLHRVDMDNVEETVSGIVLLNRKLRAARFSVMHHLTMDSMARTGLDVLVSRRPTSDASSDDTELGQCMACDGFGAVHTLCSNCEDSGMLYDRIEPSDGSSVLPELSQGPWPDSAGSGVHDDMSRDDRNGFLASMGEEVDTVATHDTWKAVSKESLPSDGANSSEGTCPTCDASGSVGEICATCDNGSTYLNFRAGL